MAKKDNSFESILQQYSAEKKEEFLSTGVLVLDNLFGGGIYVGGMYGFWGPAGCGKSTLTFQILRKFLKEGHVCAFVDVEKAFNKSQQEVFKLREYVENGKLFHLTADNYVQVGDICKAIAKDGRCKLVVVDSESQLLPKLPDDTDISSAQPGQKSRQAQLLLTMVKSMFYQAGISSIWLFHARANIDMMAGPYAPKDKQAGGYAAKHIPDVLLHLNPGQKIKDGDEIQGQVVHAECDKNKFTAPFVKKDFKLYFGKGVDKKTEIIDLCIENGLITQSGAYYSLPNGDNVRGTQALYNLPSETMKVLQEQLKVNNVIKG